VIAAVTTSRSPRSARYATPERGDADESTPLLELGDIDPLGPITAHTYGPLKAASERAALTAFGADSALIRPTYVIGSYDKTLRFPYWVWRLARGGRVAYPDRPRTHCSGSTLATSAPSRC
jgi:2'-hydroxyisoflavone reductase